MVESLLQVVVFGLPVVDHLLMLIMKVVVFVLPDKGTVILLLQFMTSAFEMVKLLFTVLESAVKVMILLLPFFEVMDLGLKMVVLVFPLKGMGIVLLKSVVFVLELIKMMLGPGQLLLSDDIQVLVLVLSFLILMKPDFILMDLGL